MIAPGMRRPWRKRMGLVALASLSLAAVTACGSPTATSSGSGSGDQAATAVYKKAESLSGQAQLDYLAKEAKSEGGKLRLYTSFSEDTMPAVVKAFEDEYGIKVQAYRATPEEIATKVTDEAKANYKNPADVVEARGFEMNTLAGGGLVRSVKGDYLDSLPADVKFDDWTADRLVMITGCWNTDKVPTADVPTSWDELISSKWKGKLSLELLDANWFETMYQYFLSQGKSDSDVEKYFRAVAANAQVVQGHTQMQQMIAAGQASYSPDCYTYVTDGQKATGAPTAWQPALEPVVEQPNGIGVNPNAKHPAAAALFYAWLLGSEGQKILADTGNTVPSQSFPAKYIPLDISGYAKDPEKWQTLWDNILNHK